MKRIIEKIKDFFSSKIKWAIDFYKDQDLLEEKMFWRIVPLTTLVGLMSLIGTICENFGIATVICVFFCTFAPLTIAILCYLDHNKCRKYYIIFCITMNCVLMPLTFIVKGGMYSGMPFYCFGFLLMCSFCAYSHDRHVTSAVSFLVYIILFFIAYFYPEVEMPIRDSFRRVDMILSFGAAAISMVIIISRAVAEYNSQRYRSVNEGLIDSVGTMIEFRSMETGNHVHNLRKFTAILLKWANKLMDDVHFTREEIDTISAASMLHDIGKIAVPDAILQKPGKLTDEEFAVMKKHPLDGCKMIESMEDFQNHQYYKYCYEICRHHHERYDGNGYPDGLKGDGIPFISQVACLADVYEALTAKRVYKDPFPPEKAAAIIHESEGKMFSSDIIRIFDAARPELEELVRKNHEVYNPKA